MSFELTITIPIEPHLKKMIAKHHQVQPFRLKKGRCFYSKIIYSTLLKNLKRVEPTKGTRYKDQLEVLMPSDFVKENRFIIDNNAVVQINYALKGIFLEKLIDYLDERCQDKGDIKTECINFMAYYELTEEDITLDALQKAFYRYRQSKSEEDNRNFRTKTKNIVQQNNSIPGDQFSLFYD